MNSSVIQLIHYVIISHKGAGDKGLVKKTKKFIIHPSTIIFLILLSLSGIGNEGLITLFCALLHELGHWFAARICGETPTRTVIYPFGADMVLGSGLRSYKSEIFIAICGPIVNLVLLFFGMILHFSEFFCACNLALAFINLMPVRGLDGGVILRNFLLSFLMPKTAERVVLGVTFTVLFFLYLFSVYFLFSGIGDPSLFVIVCAMFAGTVMREKLR